MLAIYESVICLIYMKTIFKILYKGSYIRQREKKISENLQLPRNQQAGALSVYGPVFIIHYSKYPLINVWVNKSIQGHSRIEYNIMVVA